MALPARADVDAPPDGSFFRVTVDGGVSPFTSVAYDVTVRGRAVIVSLVKESLCLKGQRERVKVLDGPDADAALAGLDRAGAWSLAVPQGAVQGRREGAPPRDGPRYEFWFARGRDMRRFHLDQTALLAAPEALAVLVALREAVLSRVEPMPMRDIYHPAAKIGFVTMTASEPAKATIDGWDTVPLPCDSLDVVEGDHQVVVRGQSGRSREFKVRVVAGTAQQVHVVLE